MLRLLSAPVPRQWPRDCLPLGLSASRKLSITCRGSSITAHDLFCHPSVFAGPVHQDAPRAYNRYSGFHLDRICDLVASVGHRSSPVTNINKIESPFSTVLLLTREDGLEVVVKLPFLTPLQKARGDRQNSTAAEAAMLTYIARHTDIPVPKVLHWKSGSKDKQDNPIGGDFILMTKAPGVQLSTKWRHMSKSSKVQLVRNLLQMEHQIAKIRFPRYGSLLLRQSDMGSKHLCCLDPAIDPDGLYCIRPFKERIWRGNRGSTLAQITMGDIGELGVALTQDEIKHLSAPYIAEQASSMFQELNGPRGLQSPGTGDNRDNSTFVAQHRLAFEARFHATRQDHISALLAAQSIMTRLGSLENVDDLARPTLWHPDLQLEDVFVARDDPSQITSIVGWSAASILPMCLQGSWPAWLETPLTGLQQSLTCSIFKLGPLVDSICGEEWTREEDEKKEVMEAIQAEESDCMRAKKSISNSQAARALNILFARSTGLRCETDATMLWACLAEFQENWSSLGFGGPAPTKLNPDMCRASIEENDALRWIRTVAHAYIGTDATGWPRCALDLTGEAELGHSIRRRYGVVATAFTQAFGDPARCAYASDQDWMVFARAVAGKIYPVPQCVSHTAVASFSRPSNSSGGGQSQGISGLSGPYQPEPTIHELFARHERGHDEQVDSAHSSRIRRRMIQPELLKDFFTVLRDLKDQEKA